MSELHSQSPAFQQALRQSERLRIYLLLALLAFILVLRGTRTVLAPTPDNIATLHMFLSLIGVLGAIELITLRMLHRAIQKSKSMARGFWFLNIFLEIALPRRQHRQRGKFCHPTRLSPARQSILPHLLPSVDAHHFAAGPAS